jgi:hypothetical protein
MPTTVAELAASALDELPFRLTLRSAAAGGEVFG